ncbi:hypothetical protein C2E23DRAFT_241351 [Lenzites betulinus]|nr:hypothetical protein C2E23DRAFT_241351 [Lenzites betulinus]
MAVGIGPQPRCIRAGFVKHVVCCRPACANLAISRPHGRPRRVRQASEHGSEDNRLTRSQLWPHSGAERQRPRVEWRRVCAAQGGICVHIRTGSIAPTPTLPRQSPGLWYRSGRAPAAAERCAALPRRGGQGEAGWLGASGGRGRRCGRRLCLASERVRPGLFRPSWGSGPPSAGVVCHARARAGGEKPAQIPSKAKMAYQELSPVIVRAEGVGCSVPLPSLREHSLSYGTRQHSTTPDTLFPAKLYCAPRRRHRIPRDPGQKAREDVIRCIGQMQATREHRVHHPAAPTRPARPVCRPGRRGVPA